MGVLPRVGEVLQRDGHISSFKRAYDPERRDVSRDKRHPPSTQQQYHWSDVLATHLSHDLLEPYRGLPDRFEPGDQLL